MTIQHLNPRRPTAAAMFASRNSGSTCSPQESSRRRCPPPPPPSCEIFLRSVVGLERRMAKGGRELSHAQGRWHKASKWGKVKCGIQGWVIMQWTVMGEVKVVTDSNKWAYAIRSKHCSFFFPALGPGPCFSNPTGEWLTRWVGLADRNVCFGPAHRCACLTSKQWAFFIPLVTLTWSHMSAGRLHIQFCKDLKIPCDFNFQFQMQILNLGCNCYRARRYDC